MTAEPTTNGCPPAGDASDRVPAAIAPVADPLPATAATVTIVQRRATDIVCGDVIALPDDVFHPLPARAGGRRTWMWRAKPWRLLNNPHRWRLVCETDHLDDDEAGIAASVPLGLRVLRVCDDHPDQGQQYQSRIIAVRGHDLIDVQARTTGTGCTHRGGQADPTGARDVHPPGTVLAYQDFPARNGVVRVFNRNDSVGSDDASDMYVLEVFGISVLVRLHTTRTHPARRPQLYLHVDNEGRPPTTLAIEVGNGGETHHRI